MKKFTFLMFFFLVWGSSHAQKKNGTVFIEHPAMEKVNMLWQAFEQGDQAAYGNLLADTVMVFFNGNRTLRTREAEIKNLEWWASEFENLKVVADTPAYADAIEYKESGVWVQDWLRIQATHIKTGNNVDLSIHNLYSFNKDGLITSVHHYFNNDVFEHLRNDQRTRENGKVYINHPYILKVRKLVNAYCAEDIEGMLPFYAEDVAFSNSTLKLKEQKDLATQQKDWERIFDTWDNIHMKQVGYPDCIYYELNNNYVVYSWWNFSAVAKEDGRKVVFPIMLSQTFNDDGKIVYSLAYYSTNHFE